MPLSFSGAAMLRQSFIMGVFLLGAGIAHADWNVSVGTSSSNGAWSGANPDVWTPSATGATVAASEINSRLAGGTPVVINTGAGGAGGAENGDISVDNAVTWSANALTLAAYRNITIKAKLNGSGTASLVLQYGQGAVAAGNTATYTLSNGAKADLPAGANFSTKLGSDGGTTAWTVITDLGLENSVTGTDLQGMFGTAAANAANLAGNYVLGADISASATSGWTGGFKPVGYSYLGDVNNLAFTGKFDGLGHTISNLTINRSGGDFGLFGWTNNAVLQNVGLLNVSISGGSNGGTGALAGKVAGTTTIRNSYVDGGSVYSSTQIVGGLVGYTLGTSAISYSYANVSVSAGLGGGVTDARAGGLVGVNNSTISYSYATGSVSASAGNVFSKWIGGLVGSQNAGGSISTSYATGAVSGNNALGGLVGNLAGGSAPTSSYWDKTTTGQATSSGGGTGLTTTEWATLGPFSAAPSDGAWSSADWGSGNPYPGVKALPYITITASASQSQGSAASFGIASILDQNGADATSKVNTGSLVWSADTTTSSPAGTAGTVSGKGATATGYQILYKGSFTVAAAPDPGPVEIVISTSGGSVTAVAGRPIRIPAGANVEGTTIDFPAAASIAVQIGGSRFIVTALDGTTRLTLRMLVIDGQEVIALSLGTGSARIRAASPGDTALVLADWNTRIIAGTADMEFDVSRDADQAVLQMRAGQVILPGLPLAQARAPAQRAARISSGQADYAAYAGERLTLDVAGRLSLHILASADGGGAGDPFPFDLPANLTVATGVPRLEAYVARLGADLDVALLASLGADTAVGQNSQGVLRLDRDGERYAALPLGTVVIDTGAADGSVANPDGTVTVSVQGVRVTFAAGIVYPQFLAQDLASAWPGTTLAIRADGVLVATLDGSAYALRPDWNVDIGTADPEGFGTDAAGSLRYTRSVYRQRLNPAFADFAALAARVEQAMSGASAATNADGTVSVLYGAQHWTLVPMQRLGGADCGGRCAEQGPWLEYPDGSSQRFTVR